MERYSGFEKESSIHTGTIDKAKKVLFWVPGGMPLMLHVEGALALALKHRGIEIQVVICDGIFCACMLRDIKFGVPVKSWKDICDGCKMSTSSVLDSLGITYSYIGDFLSKEEIDKLREISGNYTFEALKDLTYNNVNIGNNVLSGIIRYLKGYPIDGHEEVISEYAFTGLVVAAASASAYKSFQPDKVFMSHGSYVDWGPALHMALYNRLPVTVWMASYLNGCFYFKNLKENDKIDFHELSSKAWEECRNSSLSYNMNKRLDKFLYYRYHHNVSLDMSKFFNYKSGADLGEIYAFENENPIWAILAHINWDSVKDYSRMAYDDFDEWIIDTIDEIINIKDVNWLIKIHPAEVGDNPDSGIQKLIEKIFPDLPSHIKVIPSDANINPMDFNEFINGGVTVYGTAGIELAILGKPVILAGECHYGCKGFTYDGLSRESYKKFLKEAGSIKFLSEEQKELARKYAYCLLIERQIPLTVVENPDSEWWCFQSNKADLLFPGKDPFTDFICEKILDGDDFIMNEDLVKIHEQRKIELESLRLQKEVNDLEQLIKENKLKDASIKINDIIMRYPGYPDFFNTQAELEFQLENYDMAKSILLDNITKFPDNARMLNNLGVVYYNENDLEKALEYFIRSLQFNSDDRTLVFNVGETLVKLEKYEQAKKLYSDYQKKHPEDKETIIAIDNINKKLST